VTPQELDRLAQAFEIEPAFEFLSPEGSVGYPQDLHDLNVSDVRQMIAESEKYADEVRALATVEPATAD
jgi:hypothetical protein